MSLVQFIPTKSTHQLKVFQQSYILFIDSIIEVKLRFFFLEEIRKFRYTKKGRTSCCMQYATGVNKSYKHLNMTKDIIGAQVIIKISKQEHINLSLHHWEVVHLLVRKPFQHQYATYQRKQSLACWPNCQVDPKELQSSALNHPQNHYQLHNHHDVPYNLKHLKHPWQSHVIPYFPNWQWIQPHRLLSLIVCPPSLQPVQQVTRILNMLSCGLHYKMSNSRLAKHLKN